MGMRALEETTRYMSTELLEETLGNRFRGAVISIEAGRQIRVRGKHSQDVIRVPWALIHENLVARMLVVSKTIPQILAGVHRAQVHGTLQFNNGGMALVTELLEDGTVIASPLRHPAVEAGSRCRAGPSLTIPTGFDLRGSFFGLRNEHGSECFHRSLCFSLSL